MKLEFTTLLNQDSFVASTMPSLEEIVAKVHSRAEKDKMIKAMYGETYDRLGHTLDSIKYYFFVAAVGWTLRNMGINVEPTILVADVATCRNEPEKYHGELMSLGKKRVEFVGLVNQVYGLNLHVLLMSEYLFSDGFQVKLEQVKKLADENQDVYNWIKQTIPTSKVEEEAKKGFAYAFDEVATIIEYDLKVGPPREKFYDEPARQIGMAMGLDPLMSAYLHPTYPLAVTRGYYLAEEEVEQYGVTAYKAGSKGMEANRVIIGKTTIEDLVVMIEDTVISKKPTIPNALLDLAIIGEMACHWLQGQLKSIGTREQFYGGDLSSDKLKHMAIENLSQYVLDPLHAVIKGDETNGS